ncbi:TPA: hypothetical protein ACOEOW_003902 [Enterobacter hormaechei subsp. xiangfangensis]
MTEQKVSDELQAVNQQFIAMTANLKHLTAENAGLYRVFEVAMQLVASNKEWTPAQREQLTLAVKACNQVPNTAKVIREVEAAGMDTLRNEIDAQVRAGVLPEYLPGINLCLGLVDSLARQHRMMRSR